MNMHVYIHTSTVSVHAYRKNGLDYEMPLSIPVK